MSEFINEDFFISKKVKELRKAQGLTQLALSHKSGVSQAAISNIEARRSKQANRKHLFKICQGLDVSYAFILEYALRMWKQAYGNIEFDLDADEC